jgi:hypothetical protein
LQGGPPSHGPDRNDLLLRRGQGSSDLARLTIALANYMFGSSFTNHLPHFKGEKIFGYAKQLVDCPLGVDNDSHHRDHVNLSCP